MRKVWIAWIVGLELSACMPTDSEGMLRFSDQCTDQDINDTFRTETLLPVPFGFQDWRRDSFILRFDRSDTRVQVIDRKNECVAEIESPGGPISQRIVAGGVMRQNWIDSPFLWTQQAGLVREMRIAECSTNVNQYISYMINERGYTVSQVDEMVNASRSAEMNECEIIIGYDYTYFLFDYENLIYSLEIQGAKVFFGREK